ncbi:tetratricopeptide repeat protein [Streptomyces sp. OfavH-34-F]|nr:tetratricopeptide repeat protein [Streptomyces sp. OfavH-34-F]MCG7524434.1 tetratricopeptide repeat protein [Streptomyces sp. OfavH-34-F]
MPENATEVTAAGIARLAGVGRAAVSNWRRRHADFPQPVGGTETSPSFALSEVEQWLRDQGKLVEVPLRERVWQQLAGHPAGPVTALVHVGCALLLADRDPAAWREITEVSDERTAAVLTLALGDALADRFGPAGHGRAVRTPDRAELLPSVPLLRAAAELAAETGTRETYEFLLGRQLDANPRQYTLTPPGLAELMAELAGTGDAAPRTVLDPAAGTGALLAAAPRTATLYGQESDPGLAAVTALRLALRATPGTGPDVRTGDTLRADAFPELAADAVLCHPPFNERGWGHEELAYDPRWEYGLPARTESELAWVQHALARLRDEEDPAERAAAQERLIANYADLAGAVIRMVDGKMSTRAGQFGSHGFGSLDAALRWLDEESSFITSALRHAEGVDQGAVLALLGALCDYCLLRGDLYRLGEISELTQAVDQGLLERSVRWRTGIAARQLGELDKARTTLSSVVGLYREARNDSGTALALCSLGITLHHQGNLTEAAARLREAMGLQSAAGQDADRAWSMHALAAVERDRGNLAEAVELLDSALVLHREGESLHGEAWTWFQLGQVWLRLDDRERAGSALGTALELYGRTHDERGTAWATTQLARALLAGGEADAAVERLTGALAHHRDNEDARGEAWTLYHLGQALEEAGDTVDAVRQLERARSMFSRMRDVYGLACARQHSGRVSRDQRAAQTGNLRNSGFARQLLVDARADFRRIGVAHGEAWTCLDLAVIDAGNQRAPQALELCGEAVGLFESYGDARGADWARFLRCTLLPYASPGGVEVGTVVAQQELAELRAAAHPARDAEVNDCADAYGVVLERGVDLEAGWQAWTLGLLPSRRTREVMGVAL